MRPFGGFAASAPVQSSSMSTHEDAALELPGREGIGTLPRISSTALYRAALAAVLGLSAVLNIHRLAQNGYANIYYSAGVKSMLDSLHNFLFVSFDPGGLITIDKPPLALWVQVASAKLFGFTPLSLLLPEAIAGVLAVAALYWAMARHFGRPAALAGALALAVFPSFVAVARDNNLDAVLILLMILAGGTALRAVQSGSWRTLLACAVLVGLAFNTKTLAAYLIVPGIALAYIVGAPGKLPRRLIQLLIAGAVMGAISFAWIALVELTPASHRPYVGGSLNNTELGLTFEYNGLGRVGGEEGGPGRVPAVPLSTLLGRPLRPEHAVFGHAVAGHVISGQVASGQASSRHVIVAHRHRHRPPPSPILPDGRFRDPIPFGGAIGPLRLFDTNLGDQGGWMLPFALLGLVALALSLLPLGRSPVSRNLKSRDSESRNPEMESSRWRRDPRLAGGLVFGGWFLVEAAVLSLSKGIVHPYYISALGPGAAAMIGAGAVAFVGLLRRGRRSLTAAAMVLLPLAVAATVIVQRTLLDRAHYMHWFLPVLIVGAALGACAFLTLRRLAAPAMALVLGVLLLAPGAYAASTWEAPVEGTFPAAGPRQATGVGGLDVSAATVHTDRVLLQYLATHRASRRWVVLTEASNTAASMILLGADAGAMAGYSATDPALDGPGLARLVARDEARYVILGGAYSTRGGNLAIRAVPHACPEVPGAAWGQTRFTQYSLVLFDCAGRARALATAAAA
jgi:4-amino-4-deoxy-L-arabinose transferase-like glycosyltransferase